MTSRKKIVILMWKHENVEPDPIEDSPFVRAIDHAVKKALRGPKIIGRILTGVVAALVLCMAVSGYVAWQAHNTAIGLKNDSIASCETGNAFRAGQSSIWEKNYALQAGENKATASLLSQLIATLAGNDPARIAKINTILAESGKASANEIKEFLAYIKTVDVAHNCQQAYANVNGGAKSPNPPKAKEVAYTTAAPETVHLQSWNGGCLSVSSTSVGARVIEVACGSDHAWTYVPTTGELYPQGHSNVAVGDSGGNFVLKAAPGTGLHTNNSKAGPNGYIYDQLNFNATDTYWHASGDGKNVTFDNTSGDDANYWAFLSTGETASNTAVV
jgi:hypothetical protein